MRRAARTSLGAVAGVEMALRVLDLVEVEGQASPGARRCAGRISGASKWLTSRRSISQRLSTSLRAEISGAWRSIQGKTPGSRRSCSRSSGRKRRRGVALAVEADPVEHWASRAMPFGAGFWGALTRVGLGGAECGQSARRGGRKRFLESRAWPLVETFAAHAHGRPRRGRARGARTWAGSSTSWRATRDPSTAGSPKAT